jgi:Thiamine pyrophosphate enzyme, N-terminal TPP binding domain
MGTVGELIVDSLVANGIDRMFCVPGESYLGLLDALYGRGDIDTVVCRHEAGAGFMAVADARLTGRPGIACVSRGPGASNATIAVHTAQQDEVPFILIVGQVPARNTRRDSFQEIDYRAMYGSIAKWVAEVTDPARMAETLLRAIQTATTGTPGPVVIAVPEDVSLPTWHRRWSRRRRRSAPRPMPTISRCCATGSRALRGHWSSPDAAPTGPAGARRYAVSWSSGPTLSRGVPTGLEGDSDAFDPVSCLHRFLAPSMQQLQQCALVNRELLQRRALDARHDTGDQPTRLRQEGISLPSTAHNDHIAVD